MDEEDEYEKVTLYADNKPYQVIDLKDVDKTYEEYMNRMLSESVQYKPKEEDMAKYYNYEVEEQEEERPEESTDWSEVVFAIVYWGILFGILIYAIIKVVNGG